MNQLLQANRCHSSFNVGLSMVMLKKEMMTHINVIGNSSGDPIQDPSQRWERNL